MTIKAILTDIEGTTSSIAFVFEVLFPYAKQHLPDYVRNCAMQDPQSALLQAVRDEAQEPDADVERVITILAQWMTDDVKATSLKALQGLVWQQGYASGEIKGHVYPDAVAALQAWQQQGYQLYVQQEHLQHVLSRRCALRWLALHPTPRRHPIETKFALQVNQSLGRCARKSPLHAYAQRWYQNSRKTKGLNRQLWSIQR